MKYNTRSIKNIDDELFVGRFSGVDFDLESGQVRYLPSYVSEHLARQLLEKINRGRRAKREELARMDEILGQEIETAEQEKNPTFKEEIENHEKEFKIWQTEKEKEKILKRDEALNISENL